MSDLVINPQRRFQLPKARWDIRESMFVLVSRYQNFQEFEKNSKLGSISFLWDDNDYWIFDENDLLLSGICVSIPRLLGEFRYEEILSIPIVQGTIEISAKENLSIPIMDYRWFSPDGTLLVAMLIQHIPTYAKRLQVSPNFEVIYCETEIIGWILLDPLNCIDVGGDVLEVVGQERTVFELYVRRFFNMIQYEEVERSEFAELEAELKRMKVDNVVSKHISSVINDALGYL